MPEKKEVVMNGKTAKRQGCGGKLGSDPLKTWRKEKRYCEGAGMKGSWAMEKR